MREAPSRNRLVSFWHAMDRQGSQELKGQTAVVTGASKGIGAAIATALIENGARIVAHYGGDRAGAEAAVAGAAPGQATLLSADFHDMAAVDRFWAEATEALGGAPGRRGQGAVERGIHPAAPARVWSGPAERQRG